MLGTLEALYLAGYVLACMYALYKAEKSDDYWTEDWVDNAGLFFTLLGACMYYPVLFPLNWYYNHRQGS